jgi:hypothetical protein
MMNYSYRLSLLFLLMLMPLAACSHDTTTFEHGSGYADGGALRNDVNSRTSIAVPDRYILIQPEAGMAASSSKNYKKDYEKQIKNLYAMAALQTTLSFDIMHDHSDIRRKVEKTNAPKHRRYGSGNFVYMLRPETVDPHDAILFLQSQNIATSSE